LLVFSGLEANTIGLFAALFQSAKLLKKQKRKGVKTKILDGYLSTKAVDKFFLFDCQKDMKKRGKMDEFGTL